MTLSLDSSPSSISIYPELIADPSDLVKHALYLQKQLDSCNEHYLAGRFELTQYWLQCASKLVLWSVFWVRADEISLLLILDNDELPACLSVKPLSFEALSHTFKSPLLSLSDPVKLKTVAIDKPWGQEIWYTGIEKRGVAQVTDGRYSIPLPWFQAALRDSYFKIHTELVLLKILDPLPDAVYGDLYFELHEKKQEVYIVTHLNECAWPDDVGKIRIGFNQSRLSQYETNSAFLAAYRESVEKYRKLRKIIDGRFDELRRTAGISLDEPVSAALMKQWESTLPAELTETEQQLRKNMDAFTAEFPLRVGDVVKIPCLMPHALQHGVRTIEFQTPVYERKIVSFGQKVLTQAGWDTDEALKLIDPAASYNAVFELVQDDPGVKVEKIVQFDDFQVLRVCLDKGCIYDLQASNTYQIVMVITGVLHFDSDSDLQAEQACLLPAEKASQVRALSNETLFLITWPTLIC